MLFICIVFTYLFYRYNCDRRTRCYCYQLSFFFFFVCCCSCCWLCWGQANYTQNHIETCGYYITIIYAETMWFCQQFEGDPIDCHSHNYIRIILDWLLRHICSDRFLHKVIIISQFAMRVIKNDADKNILIENVWALRPARDKWHRTLTTRSYVSSFCRRLHDARASLCCMHIYMIFYHKQDFRYEDRGRAWPLVCRVCWRPASGMSTERSLR